MLMQLIAAVSLSHLLISIVAADTSGVGIYPRNLRRSEERSSFKQQSSSQFGLQSACLERGCECDICTLPSLAEACGKTGIRPEYFVVLTKEGGDTCEGIDIALTRLVTGYNNDTKSCKDLVEKGLCDHFNQFSSTKITSCSYNRKLPNCANIFGCFNEVLQRKLGKTIA